MLVRILYVSEITASISDIDVQVILGSSQMKNRRLDVTGVLARSPENFLQVLEGRREAVIEVMRRVTSSTRHCNVRVLMDEEITRRSFPEWGMGFISSQAMSEEMMRAHRCQELVPADAHALIERMARLGGQAHELWNESRPESVA